MSANSKFHENGIEIIKNVNRIANKKNENSPVIILMKQAKS